MIKKKLDNCRVVVIRGVNKRSLALRISGVDLSPMREEQPDKRWAVITCGDHERSPAAFIFSINRGMGSQELTNLRDVIGDDSAHERFGSGIGIEADEDGLGFRRTRRVR